MKSILKLSAIILLLAIAGCKKDKEEPKPVIETGTVTDADGNQYQTVKIGNQWWMAENLKVKNYRNGHPILNVTSADEWKNKTTGAYCVYDPTDVNSSKPGLLYNWFALTDTGMIAPFGWHIPTDAEWKQLEMYLGMTQTEADKAGWRGTHEGEKLKQAAPEGWTLFGDVWSTNESGFTALAGSCRLFNGEWGQPGLQATGFWWSATESAEQAAYRYLDYKNTNVFRALCPKTYGMSVRCVKD